MSPSDVGWRSLTRLRTALCLRPTESDPAVDGLQRRVDSSKNPPGDSAGLLIEAAGLKGRRQGGPRSAPARELHRQHRRSDRDRCLVAGRRGAACCQRSLGSCLDWEVRRLDRSRRARSSALRGSLHRVAFWGLIERESAMLVKTIRNACPVAACRSAIDFFLSSDQYARSRSPNRDTSASGSLSRRVDRSFVFLRVLWDPRIDERAGPTFRRFWAFFAGFRV